MTLVDEVLPQIAPEVCLARPPRPGTPTPSVAVVGLGYVGLPTALALAQRGVRVIGHDIDPGRLAAIAAHEVDLLPTDRVRLRRLFGSAGLRLTADPADLAAADVVLVCVPTPVDVHQVPDLTALRAACASVVAHAVAGQTLVLTSTSYVGSTREMLVAPLAQRGLVVGRDVFVAFSPERIDPGRPEHVPERTPRVVGGVTAECARRAGEVLALSSAAVHPVSSPEAAEMTKLWENTFRAVNIAFANELSGVARELDLDPVEIIDAAATKPFGFMAFYPGPGVGGHCIPCDPHYLLWQMRAHHVTPSLTTAAMEAIAARPRAVSARAEELLGRRGRPLAGARVLLVGVAYKAGVADVRESPGLEILADLVARGADVGYHDPLVPWIDLGTRCLRHDERAPERDWDLVVVHTLHPGQDAAWLADGPLVLDTTFRLPAAERRFVL